VKGWLRERGVQVCVLDVTTAHGLAEAAWLEVADLGVVPVLILRARERELVRYVGSIPAPAELRRVLELVEQGEAAC
jgi:hypothetical protein